MKHTLSPSIGSSTLPASLAALADQQHWSLDLQAALTRSLEAADVTLASDVIETLGDPAKVGLAPRDQAAYLSSLATPEDVHSAFLGSADWLDVVRLADLSDVIGDATVWTDQLVGHLEFWGVPNAMLNQTQSLAAAVGHTEVIRHSGYIDATDILLDLAKVVDPQTMTRAWRKLRPHLLTTAETNELKSLQAAIPQSRSGKRHTRYHAAPAATAAFVEQLQFYRRRNVSVAQLSRVTEISRQRTYQLTRKQ